jgi:hypothetical protein
VVLPLATMVVAAAGSATVRTALLHLTELQQNNRSLEQQNHLLTASVDSSRQQKDVAEQEAAAARQRAQEARRGLAAAQTQLTAAQASLGTTQGKLRAADERRKQLDAEVKNLEESRQRLETKLAQAGGKLVAAARQLAATNGALRAAVQAKAVAYQEVKTLQDTRDRLLVDVDHAQAALAKAQRNVAATQDELDAKTKQLHATEDKLKAEQDALGMAGNLYAQSETVARLGRVRYEPGTVLIRATIGTGQSLEQIETSLRELEVVASKKAEEDGVLAPEGGLAVRLILPVPPETAFGEPPNEDAILRMGAEEIRESGAGQCVAVIAVALRSFAADNRPVPVAAELSIRRNTVVYTRGTVIVHRVIDGSRPRAEVFQELWGVPGGLLGDLHEAAQQAGLMPDPKSGQYGEIPAEELLQALDTLLASKQEQEVEAVATQDVWVANEPLFTVTLKVGPPQEPGGE